jgi:hypothetical protein
MSAQKLQANRAAVIVPSNTKNIVPPWVNVDEDSLPEVGCLLYVGGTGNIKVLTTGNDEVTFVNFPGGFFPVQVIRVYSTGTTATNIMGLW